MKTSIKLPRMGDTVDEVVILEWSVNVGDTVKVGDPLMRVETDKVDAELPSPVDGVILELLVAPDDDVTVGTVVCTIET